MSSGDYLTGESRQFALAANKDQSRAELTSDLGDSHLLGAKLLGQSRAIEPKLRGAYASRRVPRVVFGVRVSGTLPQRGSLCPPNRVFPARRRKLHAGTRALPGPPVPGRFKRSFPAVEGRGFAGVCHPSGRGADQLAEILGR
jgi:hypothetical protein